VLRRAGEEVAWKNGGRLTHPDLAVYFSRKIVGQLNAAERILPFIQTFQAGLSPANRPIGVFLLLGPTGTGKTRTVEVLAEALHGSAQKYLRIDCGQFQLDREVAKLIGAPPGYIGHGETVPALSKQKLAEAITPECNISLVLIDEIEKAAPALTRVLLGLLDTGRLALADGSVVSLENSLIFMTSNLGAGEMMRQMTPSFGFEVASKTPGQREDLAGKLEAIGVTALRKMFSPEFLNRIDAVITYLPLSAESIRRVLDNQIEDLQDHVNSRLGNDCFSIALTESARQFLLNRGVSTEYGVRELKRTVYRYLTQPLATMVAENRVRAGSLVMIEAGAGDALHFEVQTRDSLPSERQKPCCLSWTTTAPAEILTSPDQQRRMGDPHRHLGGGSRERSRDTDRRCRVNRLYVAGSRRSSFSEETAGHDSLPPARTDDGRRRNGFLAAERPGARARPPEALYKGRLAESAQEPVSGSRNIIGFGVRPRVQYLPHFWSSSDGVNGFCRKAVLGMESTRSRIAWSL
jgi:DNA polymerase III delta prime subunit